MKTLVLIDGHSLAYRMHFALERTGLSTSQKVPTWAVYGFFNALFSLLKQVQPDGIAISFDMGRETFRNQLYEAYKAHRESMPDALRSQLSIIQEGIERLGIPIYQLPNYEADDVIGTLAKKGAAAGMLVKILTGDQDAFQLIHDGQVEVLLPGRTPKEGLRTYNRQAVFEKLGVYPEQVRDFTGLKGDTSDNIPGIPGVGDKTAAKLLADYQTLENIYAHLAELPPNKLKEKLETYQDQAFLSKKLATIDEDSPVEVSFDDCHLIIPDIQALVDFFDHYEFRTFTQQAPTLLAPFLNGHQVTVTPPVSVSPVAVEMKTEEASPQSSSTQTTLGLEVALDYWHPAYTLITEEETLRHVCETIRQVGVFALDLETTGLDSLTAQIVGVALSVSPALSCTEKPAANLLHLKEYPQAFGQLVKTGEPVSFETFYVPILHQAEGPQLSEGMVLEALKPLLQDPEIVKVVHNAKYELNIFHQYGIPLNGLVFDTMLASYVQNTDRRHGLKDVAHDLLGHRMHTYTELTGTGKKAISFETVPLEQAAQYAAADAQATLELALYFTQQFNSAQATLFYEIENPLAAVLARLERTGVSLDTAYLKQLSSQLEERLNQLETEIYQLAGCTFNLNSPKQVGDVLFEKLGIKPLRKTPTKSGYSTDAKVLEQLAPDYEVVRKLLDYRQLFKLRSTYVDNLPELIHRETGRIHTSFNQTVTATGRLSSSGPNLQNIPIRSEVGRFIRQTFVPEDRENWVILSADYSQIELRLLAHFSEDPHLMEAFQSGEDVHTLTAALVFGIPKEAVTKEQRYRAKAVNFGVIYGQSAHGLSQQLNITRAEAQAFIDGYFKTYDHVKDYIESVKQTARETGQVTTLCGRVRDLSEGLKSPIRSVREFSERAAFNAPLQGSAADLMKVAMIRLDHKLQEAGLRSKMILQVHDELVLEVPKEEVEAVTHWILWAMALDQPLRVPLEVDVHTGTSWMEA